MSRRLNVLKTIDLHIEYILATQGTVTVAGVGTFAMHSSPATIDGTTMYAPGVDVSFDSYDADDDGTLVLSLSRAEQCDESSAKTKCHDSIRALQQRLAVDGQYTIGNVCSLEQRNGATTLVNPATPTNSWLKQIELTPLATENPAEATEEVIEAVRREDFLRSMRRTASGAAAIAILAFLAFVFAQLPSRTPETRTASIAPSLGVQPIGSTSAASSDSPLVLVLNTPADASCDVEPEPATFTPGRYCLVIASLASRAEAEKYISVHGPGLHILESSGRYRIYSLTADTFGELQDMARANEAYTRYPSAWICRR